MPRTRTTHGMKGTSEYVAWNNMRSRCGNPKNSMFKHYGGRGIKVSPEFRTFEGFFSEIGKRPPGMTLERVDVNKDYEPGNVVWASTRAQSLNRTDNRRLTHNGKTQTLKEWSEETGMKVGTIWRRLHIGMSVADALDRPVMTPSEIGLLGATSRFNPSEIGRLAALKRWSKSP